VANRTDEHAIQAIAALRRLRFTGPAIAEVLDRPLSTVSGILTRIGMGQLGRLARGLPEIELMDLAAAISRQLERPRRRRIERPQFGHIVVDERLAAVEAELGDQLKDPEPRQPRILAQQPLDLVPVLIQL
jgi:hypothetical protein